MTAETDSHPSPEPFAAHEPARRGGSIVLVLLVAAGIVAIAVALSYDRGMSAPVCVAKGVDNIALKIREIAGKHDIPIVENVPLARALYATVDIDEEIPVEHYHAVAEIIGYVMGLKRGLAGRRMS